MELGGHFSRENCSRSLPSLVDFAVTIAGGGTSTDFQNTCLLTVNTTINTEQRNKKYRSMTILRHFAMENNRRKDVVSSQQFVATGSTTANNTVTTKNPAVRPCGSDTGSACIQSIRELHSSV